MRKPKKPKNQAADSARFTAPISSLPEIGGSKVPKVRHAGHLVDQKLKYNDPSKAKSQLELFDFLNPKTGGEVEKYEVKYEGIRLTAAEDRLLSAIYSLLRENSEHKNSAADDFYGGNHESGAVTDFAGEQVKPIHIRIVPADLYKAYLGNSDYSGKEIGDINKTLVSISAKRFLMKYDRVRRVKAGKKWENRTDRIEVVKNLIQVVKYTKDLTDQELAKLDSGDESIRQKKGELIIALNPVLTDQINTKYVEYPQDINRRTIIAAGGDHRNVTLAINTLRDYLLRELSARRYQCEINADKLPYVLKLDKYVREGRKKKIKETVEKAIQTCKSLGLLREFAETQGAEGQVKLVFTLNPDFE